MRCDGAHARIDIWEGRLVPGYESCCRRFPPLQMHYQLTGVGKSRNIARRIRLG